MSTDAQIRNEIVDRNSVRSEAALPLLDEREFAKLKTARAARVMEGAFRAERNRFDEWIRRGDGFWSKAGRWSQARQQIAKELRMGEHIRHVLDELGYRLAEDAWETDGRRTYVHDDNLDRQFLKDLQSTLVRYGWVKDKVQLRCFQCAGNGEMIEIEPGGAETSGHFLHHLKPE